MVGSSREDKTARLEKMMERTVMGTKTGYAEEEGDVEAGAIETAAVSAAAGKRNGCLLTTFLA